MKTTIKKKFDAVEYMRQQRDRISKETANMSFEQLKEYLDKKRPKERILPSRQDTNLALFP
jgi:hypothetical protein